MPIMLPAGFKVAAIAEGQFHSLVVTSTGEVSEWGRNNFGQLPTGSDIPVPTQLPAGTNVVAVRAAKRHGYEFDFSSVAPCGCLRCRRLGGPGSLGGCPPTTSTLECCVVLIPTVRQS